MDRPFGSAEFPGGGVKVVQGRRQPGVVFPHQRRGVEESPEQPYTAPIRERIGPGADVRRPDPLPQPVTVGRRRVDAVEVDAEIEVEQGMADMQPVPVDDAGDLPLLVDKELPAGDFAVYGCVVHRRDRLQRLGPHRRPRPGQCLGRLGDGADAWLVEVLRSRRQTVRHSQRVDAGEVAGEPFQTPGGLLDLQVRFDLPPGRPGNAGQFQERVRRNPRIAVQPPSGVGAMSGRTVDNTSASRSIIAT